MIRISRNTRAAIDFGVIDFDRLHLTQLHAAGGGRAAGHGHGHRAPAAVARRARTTADTSRRMRFAASSSRMVCPRISLIV